MLVARPVVLRCASLLVGVLLPGLAQAGNGIHPRTPVKWEPGAACMTIVDRTVDPKFTFNYTIPYEDLRPGDSTDEVDDSRRHQFIALCADHSPQIPMPEWLSLIDIETVAKIGIVEPADVDPENVLEQNPEWKDCFVRITGDDERRLITFAEAAKPVTWDTTGAPVGAYVVSGYTWEPVFNIWSDRPGLVKVIDDPDPAANPPALVITNTGEIKYPGEVMNLVGCLDAMDGSTITGYWAITGDDTPDVLEWNSFGVDTPVSGDSFELPFMPPEQTIAETLAIKIEIVDPMDRRYTAHMADLASVLNEPAPSECTDSGVGFISMPGCDSDGGDTGDGSDSDASAGSSSGGVGPTGGEPTDSAADDTTAGAPLDPVGEGGCGGCALGGAGAPALLVAPWLLWTARRRRRACR